MARLAARLMCPIRALPSCCIPSSTIAINWCAAEDGQLARSERHAVMIFCSSSIALCNACHLAEFVPTGSSKPTWSSTSSGFAYAVRFERRNAIKQNQALALHEDHDGILVTTIFSVEAGSGA